jgi:ADP-heptose:LPS heptosyltransferase
MSASSTHHALTNPPGKRQRWSARYAGVALRDLALFGFDLFCQLTPAPRVAPTTDVLIVRADALGDFVLWLASARPLRNHYAGRRLVLWCDQSVVDLARQTRLFDEVVGFSPRRLRVDLRYRAKLIRQLRLARFDVLLHPVYSRTGDFADGESLVRAARARTKIGYRVASEERSWRSWLSDRWYAQRIASPDGVRMELQRNADLLKGLGMPGVADLPTLNVDAAPDRDYFVLFPGAGLSHRRWPVERFIEVGRRLNEATGWRGVICGGGPEVALGQAMERALPGVVKSRAGKTSLVEFASLVAGAHVVISNDTSAAHIAAATSTPVVVVLGGGEPGRFYPYDVPPKPGRPVPLPVRNPMTCDGCNWSCVHRVRPDEPFPCIASVSVDQIWDALRQALPATDLRRLS